MHRCVAVVAVTLLLAGCMETHDISGSRTASLRVLVLDLEAQPVAGAEAFVGNTSVWGVTGLDGSVVIAGLREGTHLLTVSKFGFETATQDVTLEGGRSTQADVTLYPKAVPSLNQYLWTEEGVCSRSSGPNAPTAPCGNNAQATTRSGAKPPWPKDLYNVTFTMTWSGPVKRIEFEIGFGDRLPLRDGRTAINASGESPVVVQLEPQLISKAMRRPGSAPYVRAMRPMGTVPSDFSQTFHAKVHAWYRDPSPMAKYPLNTTIFSQNYSFPKASGDAGVAGSFDIVGIDHIIEVRPRLKYDCPYDSRGANLTFVDAFGRSFVEKLPDYGTSAATYRFCVLNEAQPYLDAHRQVLWDGPGTWSFRSGGMCGCKLWLELVKEDWPGME